jgi:hypothetical protein
VRTPTCRKLADSIGHGEDGGHGANVRKVEAQGGVSYHDWSAVREAATGEVESGVAAGRQESKKA